MSETATEQPPVNDGQPTPANPPAPPADPPAPAPAQDTEIDWKAEARKWEKRAKENSKAADELDKVRKAGMSEQEKAVADAEKRARQEAAVDYGKRLARAEFKAAGAAKGLDLGEALDLIDTTRFVDDSGDVDEAEIKKAVTKLAKIAAAKAPGASGGDFTGGTGTGAPPKNLRDQIAEAERKGDWKTARQLKSHLLLQTSQ